MKDLPNIPSLPFSSMDGAASSGMPDTEEFQKMIAQGATMLRAMMNQMPAQLSLPNIPMAHEDKSILTELPKMASNQVEYYFLRGRQPNPQSRAEPLQSNSPAATARGAMLSGASAFNVQAVRKDF